MKMIDKSGNLRQPGRPRAIPKELENHVIHLYEAGNGYSAVARILRGPEYSIGVHFSSVRKTLIRLDKVREKDTSQ